MCRSLRVGVVTGNHELRSGDKASCFLC